MEEPAVMGTLAATEPSSRRDLLTAATSIAGVLALGSKAEAQSPPPQSVSPEMILLRRCTYGPKPSDVQAVQQLGFNGWVERQLTMTDADNEACEAEVRRLYPRVYMGFRELRTLDDNRSADELFNSTLYRKLNSARQLYERMVEFWCDHFNLDWHKCSGYPVLDFLNVAIRRHAFGTFPELLSATAHHGAMMAFLDNERSRSGHPNENYARELMELHTLGVGGGYTETDVKEVARCLTGWSTGYIGQPDWREFSYHDIYHEDGIKNVLGHTIPAGGGQQDGERVLQILGNHPSTAHFIANKLVAWFMGPGNFTTLVNQVAQTYLNSGGDIKSMLRTILKASTLALSKPKFKRPVHFFVSGLRALGCRDIEDYGTIGVPQSGQELFSWPLPDGYPDAASYWSGHMLPRWNFAFNVMSRGIRQVSVDWKPLIGVTRAPDEVADKINFALFSGTMPQAEYDRLREFLLRPGPIRHGAPVKRVAEVRIEEAFALAMCFPAFQWY